jgi:ketosteroid isomerase-like protein
MAGCEETRRSFRSAWIVPALVVLMTGAVPLAAPSMAGQPAGGVRAAAADEPAVSEVGRLIDRFLELWKANRLDELVAGFYADDAVMVPPNHEPIHGREAILAYLKGLRGPLGEFDEGDHRIRVTAGADRVVSWVGRYSFRGGTLRLTTHELYVRQPDGSMRCAVDMFGYRDPLR